MLPFVSCICPTYNRYPAYGHLLEEAVESFLRQDYPADRRQLLILNDCSGQTLTVEGAKPDAAGDPLLQCERGTVRVGNMRRRFASLGDKYNFGIYACGGEPSDLVCCWEDDDLSLDHRISQAVERLGEADYWKPCQVVYLPAGSPPIFRHNVGVRHHASIFRRSAWQKVGGYPPISGAQDAAFDSLLRQHCHVAPEPDAYTPGAMPPSEWQYVYRFGISPVHLSGVSPHDEFYRRVGEMPVVPGRFSIKPHWREDYPALCRAALPVPTIPTIG